MQEMDVKDMVGNETPDLQETDDRSHSVHFGLAMNDTISNFAEMCKKHGGVTECLRYLLLKRHQRKYKYQFQPLTHEACEWHVISVDEEINDLQSVLQELDNYVNMNRLKDRASGIEELMFATDNADASGNSKTAKNVLSALTIDPAVRKAIPTAEFSDISIPLMKGEGEEDTSLSLEDDIDDDISALRGHMENGQILDVIVSTDSTKEKSGSKECKYCNKKFRTNNIRRQHACKHRNEDLPKCPICGERFNNKFNVQRHSRQVHRRHLTFDKKGNFKIVNRELLECDECDYVALRAGRMSTHRKDAHGIVDQIACDLCGKIFSTHRQCQHHISQLHTLINVACDVCGKICKNRSAFQRHHLSHTRTFQCSYCPKTFNKRRSYSQHEKRHVSGNNYQCPQCSRTFNQRANMQRHVKVVHLKEGELMCEQCSYKTFYAISLRQHIERVHHGIKRERFHCDVCKKGFLRRLAFQEHMDKHEGRYRYSCEKCGKDFRNKSRCKQHFLQCNGTKKSANDKGVLNKAVNNSDNGANSQDSSNGGLELGIEETVFTLTEMPQVNDG